MNDLKGIIEDCNKSDLISDKVIKKIIEIIGQEEWQELHDENNDVCTTMGELIITLKGITELEEENTKLKAYNEKLLDGDIEKHNKIVELEGKLNNLAKVAEVRLANWQKCAKDIEVLTKDKDYFSDALDKQIEATLKLLKEFYKAKELIKRLLKATYGEGWNYSLQVKIEAEKFLKESE